MPPIVILIRHAQGEHNVRQEYQLHDPPLTEKGIGEARRLNTHFREKEPLARRIETIICSPMRRTIQTMLYGLEDVLQRPGVKIEMDASWQENSDKPCDTGTALPVLREEFSHHERVASALELVDPVYPRNEGIYSFTRAATLERGQRCLRSLHARPEEVIAVVSHSGFLRTAVSGGYYANADYRIFDMRVQELAATEPGGEGAANLGEEARVELVEWEQTARKRTDVTRGDTFGNSGGLGLSLGASAGLLLGDFPVARGSEKAKKAKREGEAMEATEEATEEVPRK